MRTLPKISAYLFLTLFAIVMVYPLLWLISASFRSNAEIFTSIGLIPKHFNWDGFIKGWQGTGQYSYTTFYLNSLMLVIPTVVGTLISSVVVAYGFVRFEFPMKKILF